MDISGMYLNRYEQLMSSLPEGNYTILVMFEQEIIIMTGSDKKQPYFIRQISFGKLTGADRFFKHTPPTFNEIEHAIEVVEDELMKFHRELPSNSKLVCADEDVLQIWKLVLDEQKFVNSLSASELETVFSRYVAMLTGRPASQDTIPTDNTFGFTLLFLREVMAHLRFTTVELLELK